MVHEINHTCCGSNKKNVDWYVADDGKKLVKQDVPKKVARLDLKLKEFIELCEQLDGCIYDLTNELDHPRRNSNFNTFRKEVNDIKEDAIVLSYSRKCLEWRV